MLTIQQVNSAIMMQSWTNDELNSMIDAVKFTRSSLSKQVKYQLRVGDRVQYRSAKFGTVTQGTVMKIAQKYVTVATGQGLWKVPANMLTKVETELA
jgi:hypothetical protein